MAEQLTLRDRQTQPFQHSRGVATMYIAVDQHNSIYSAHKLKMVLL